MNRRFVAGTMLTTAFAMGPEIAMASGVANPDSSISQCAPVHDEFDNSVESQLQAAIDAYTAKRVPVQVDVLRSASAAGITDQQSMDTYITEQAAECGDGPNYVSIVVTEGPNHATVYAHGNMLAKLGGEDGVINESDDLGSMLRNSDGQPDFQADIATELNKINPFIPPHHENIPVLPITEGVLGALVLSGLVTRGVRGRMLYTAFAQPRGRAKTLWAVASELNLEGDELLGSKPANDGLVLRNAVNNMVTALEPLGVAETGAHGVYKSERFKLWPNLNTVRSAASELASQVSSMDKLTAIAKEQVGTYRERGKMLIERTTTFGEQVVQANDVAGSMSENGWDLTAWQEQLNGFGTAAAQIDTLVGNNYTDKPSEMLDRNEEALATFIQNLNNINRRRLDADRHIDSQNSIINNYRGLAAEATSILAELFPATYNHDDFVDLETGVATLDQRLQALVTHLNNSAAFRSVKSVTAVESAEKVIGLFDAECGDIDGITRSVTGRKVKLEQIQESIPGRMESIDMALSEVHSFAFSEMHDIEESTRQRIANIQGTVTQLHKKIGLGRPSLLNIDTELTSSRSTIGALREQASKEKQEMVDLRSDIERLDRSARQERSQTTALLLSNAGDLIAFTLLDDVSSARTDLGRQGLRSERDRKQQEHNNMVANKRQAIALVAAADARREAARRAEELQRQQQQLNSSSDGSGGMSSWGDNNNNGGAGGMSSW